MATYMKVHCSSGQTCPGYASTLPAVGASGGGGGGDDDDDDSGVAQSPGAEGDDKGDDEAADEGDDEGVDVCADKAADEEAEALRWLESAEQLWLVKWRGLSYDHCTWESHRTAGGAQIASFKAREP